MKMTVYEGTVEEIAKIARAIHPTATSIVSKESPPETSLPVVTDESMDAPTDSNAPQEFVSVELARVALTRRPLSEGQKMVLGRLKAAHPEWVSRDELLKVTSYTRHQFAGLMGAFGRRVTHTEGFVANTLMFDVRWNEDLGAWDYRLPDNTYEALILENLL